MAETPTRRLPWKAVRIVALGVAAAGVVASVVIALAAREHPYARAVLWAALVLASFVGWGTIVNSWVAPRTRLDWGLRAGWGMCLSILLGGFLCVTHLAGRVTLVGQVVVGLGGVFAEWVARGAHAPSEARLRRRLVVATGRFGPNALVVGGYLFVALFALACFGDHNFYQPDDAPFYMPLAEKLVQTGSMLEPFAARRIVILGGHVYLHAIFLAVGSPYYLHVVDSGLCPIIAVGLVVGHVRRSGLKDQDMAPLVLALLLFFSLRSVRVNTGSLYSGVVAVVTLYRTVRVPLGTEPRAPAWPMETQRVCILASLTLAAILLRTSLAGAVMPFALVVFAFDFVMSNRRPWESKALRSFVRVLTIFAAVLAVGLLPWSVMLKQSCGTFFYPLGHGNMTPGLSFLTHQSGDVLARLTSNTLFDKPIVALPLFLVAGLVPLPARGRYDLTALTIGSLICILTLTRSGFSPDDTSRFFFATVVALALMAAASARRSGPLATIVGIALAVQLATSVREWPDSITSKIGQARSAYQETDEERAAWESPTQEYRDVQSHVPPGATMATAVRQDFRFDFRRNTVFTLDALGGMGPRPGWPTHQGSEALAKYLRDCGVSYVVWEDFNQPGEMYNRDHWRRFLAGAKGSTLGEWAESHLDGEDAIEALSKTRRMVFVGHGMTVVDLNAPPGST
jgi:hypothetical protein